MSQATMCLPKHTSPIQRVGDKPHEDFGEDFSRLVKLGV